MKILLTYILHLVWAIQMAVRSVALLQALYRTLRHIGDLPDAPCTPQEEKGLLRVLLIPGNPPIFILIAYFDFFESMLVDMVTGSTGHKSEAG